MVKQQTSEWEEVSATLQKAALDNLIRVRRHLTASHLTVYMNMCDIKFKTELKLTQLVFAAFAAYCSFELHVCGL